jgi:hypothetical protein
MIPSSRQKGAVQLFQASNFPHEWVFVKDLITGNFADASIINRDGLWWLYILSGEETLVLYYARELTGSWTEHPMSPLIKNDRDTSRPGGRVIIHNNKIIRYVQDGYPIYGNSVRVFQVDSLSTSFYSEHELTSDPILTASGSGWNADGMHHIDPHRLSDSTWIACVDGKYLKSEFDLGYGAYRIVLNINELIDDLF